MATADEKRGDAAVSATEASRRLESNHLHVVQRGDGASEYTAEKDEDNIVGYDASLMRDRVMMNSTEETKLLRRIDLRLLPLLALMYVVKTVRWICIDSRLRECISSDQALPPRSTLPMSPTPASWTKARSTIS